MKMTQENYVVGGNTVMKQEERVYTIDDIEKLPEGKRAELIDGKMYMLAAPTITHQRILLYLGAEFHNYIKKNEGECEPFIAPVAVYLDESNNYVEPDLIVVCDKKKMDEKGCHGAPDKVVEIVSPSSKRMDYAVKLFKYRMYGVREYWIVDSEKKRVQVYDLMQEDVREYAFGECVPVGIYGGELKIDFLDFV